MSRKWDRWGSVNSYIFHEKKILVWNHNYRSYSVSGRIPLTNKSM